MPCINWGIPIEDSAMTGLTKQGVYRLTNTMTGVPYIKAETDPYNLTQIMLA